MPGFDLGTAIITARQHGILTAGGGHEMAAGFSLEAGQLTKLRAFLAERLAEQRSGAPLVPELAIDGVLAPAGARREIIDAIARLGPFGSGNPEPRFAITGARIVRADVVGKRHVRCVLAGEDGARVQAIAFRALDTELGPALLAHSGGSLHVAGHLRLDDWGGRTRIRVFIDDVAANAGV